MLYGSNRRVSGHLSAALDTDLYPLDIIYLNSCCPSLITKKDRFEVIQEGAGLRVKLLKKHGDYCGIKTCHCPGSTLETQEIIVKIH